MGRRITEPRAPIDAFNPPDDSAVILHDDATAQKYRKAAEEARRRGPGRVTPAQEPAPVPPGEAPLPLVNVARAVAGREIGRLRKQADDIERDIARGAWGAGGAVVEHLVVRQRESRALLEEVRAEVERLDSMNDDQVRRWAGARGVR
jgi:hypothetical protein